MQLGGSNSGSDSNNNDNSSPFRNQIPNSLLDAQINPRNPDWEDVLRDIKDDLRVQHRWDMLRDMEQNAGGRNTARNLWGVDNNIMNMSNTNINNTMSEEPGAGGTASGASGDSSGGSAGRPAAVKYKVRTDMERGARNDPFRYVDTQQTPSISQGTSDATLGVWMPDALMGITMAGPGGIGESNSSGTGGSNSNNTGSNKNSNSADQGFTLGKSQRDDIGGLSMAAVAWNTTANVDERRSLETDNDRIAYIGESQKKTNRTENPPNAQSIRAASSGSGSSSHNSSDKQKRAAGPAGGSQDSSGYPAVGSPGHNAATLRKVSVGEDTGFRDPLESFDVNSSALAADAMSTDTNTMMAAAEWAYREAAGGGAGGYENMGDNVNDSNYPESASATSGSGSQDSRGHSQNNSETNDPTASGSRPRSSDPSSGGRDFSTPPGPNLIENLDPENMNQLVSDAMQGRLASDLQRSLRNATHAAAEADAAVEAASFAYRASLSAMEKAANESLDIQEMTKKLVAAARDAYIRARVTALAGRKSLGISKENVETEKRGFDAGLWDCIDVALQGGSSGGSGSGSGSGGQVGTSGSGGQPGPSGSSGQPGTSGSGAAAGSGSFPAGQGGVLSGSISGPTGSTGQSGHTGSSGGSYENSEEKRIREVQRQQQENRRQKHDTLIQQEEQDLVEMQRQLLEERERDLARAQNRLDLEVRYDQEQHVLIQQKDDANVKQQQQARAQDRVRHKQRARAQQSNQIQQEIRRQQERRELDDTRVQREGTQKQEEIKQQQDEIRQQQMQIQQQQMQLDVQRRQLEQLQQQQIQLLQQQRQFLQYAAGSGFSNGSSGPSNSLTGSDSQQGDEPGQRVSRDLPDNGMANQPRAQLQPQTRPQDQSIGCHLCGADCTQRKAVYCSRSACMKWYCEQCLQYLLPADSLESVLNGTRSFLCFHCRKCCPQWSKCMSPESM